MFHLPYIYRWSFGVLMWEVVTLGGRPYADSGTEDLYTQLMSGVRLSKPIHCAQPVYDIMSMCWETIPQHRPMFFEINDNLENMNLSKMVHQCNLSYINMCYVFSIYHSELPRSKKLQWDSVFTIRWIWKTADFDIIAFVQTLPQSTSSMPTLSHPLLLQLSLVLLL